MTATRIIEIHSDLKDDLFLRSFSGSEEMSRLFHFNLDMICVKGEIDNNKITTNFVGKNVTLRLDLQDGERYFNGHISRVAADYNKDGATVYRAEMVPWLWFLTQTSNCRIFQNQSVKEIIETIFDDLGFKDFDTSGLEAEYPKWEYCVQYRETDFNFVSRLMEQCGIYYYFIHEKENHKLMLADSTNGYGKVAGEKIDFPKSRNTTRTVKDHITDWERELEFVSGKWAQTDYNFESSQNNLYANTETKLKHSDAKKYEIYDYPGEYKEKKDGDREIKVRMEEEECPFDQITGSSNCRVFFPGAVFEVGQHPSKAAEGGKFLLTSVQHQASAGAYTTGATTSTVVAEYTNSFTCIPDSVSFRPTRITPKPLVSGIQTAVVTGPENEEIYTDKHGRVKVQFHWDREVDNPKMAGNGKDKRERDQSSCFIRCAQNSAGKSWGFMSIPRIGQEVVIDFLEGDPDRPLIVGSVYNDLQEPHYDPSKVEHKAKTYFKTNTTKGGNGFNELMFDDAKDKEQVFIHAQKDMDVRVRNDSKERIYGNRHQIIGWEKDGEKGGDQSEMIWQDKHLNVKRNQVDHIEGNTQRMIGNGDADDGGILDTVIENMERRKIGADGFHLDVEGNVNQKIGGNLSVECTEHHEKAADFALESAQNVHIKAGMNVVIEAGMQITLKVGGNFVSLTPVGVDIMGTLVQLNTSGAAGSGTGANPEQPKPSEDADAAEPKQARIEKTGHKSSPD